MFGGNEIKKSLEKEQEIRESKQMADKRINVDPEDLKEYLIELAKKKRTITYSELLQKCFDENIKTIHLFNTLKKISYECIENKQPLLSILVVNKNPPIPGKGFFDNKTLEYRNYYGSNEGEEALEFIEKEHARIWEYNWD